MEEYKILIVPSSDYERDFEEINTYKEAVDFSVRQNEGVADIFMFKTRKERDAFIKGYTSAIGFLGDGIYYTNN